MVEEVSSAQTTIRRLLQAEKQAQEILQVAEEHAKESVAQAQEQARQRLEAVRRETENALRARLDEVKSKAAAEAKARIDQVESEALEIERRARENFPVAIEMVVNWVTGKGGQP